MKKLLITAVLGLGLGGGAWKMQNPEGTLDDFRAQATTQVERLKTGITAIRESSPKVMEDKAAQLAKLEEERNAKTAEVDDRISKLESMISSIPSTNLGSGQSDASSSGAAESNGSAAASGDIAAALARLESTEQKLAEAEQRLAEFEEKFTATDEKITRTEAIIVETEAKITSTDAKLAETDAKIANAESMLADNEAKFTSANSQFSETIATLTAGASGSSATNELLATTSAQISETDSRLSAVSEDLAEFGAKLTATEETIASSIAKQADMQASLNTVQSSVQDVKQSLDTVSASAGNQAEMEASLSAVQTSVQNVQQSLESVTAANQTQQEEMQASLAAVQTSVQDVQQSLNTVSESSVNESTRLNAIDNRLSLVVRRLNEQTHSEDIEGLLQGLQTLSADIVNVRNSVEQQGASTAGEIATVNEKANSLDNRLDTLAALAQSGGSNTGSDQSSDTAPVLATLSAGIDERFGALEERLQTVNADSRRIGSLNDQFTAMSEEIAALKQQNENYARQISSMTSELASVRTASESLSIETVQAEIRQQLASVQTQLENSIASDSSAELESLIDTTRNRIRTLEQRVQELPASSSEADNALKIQSALEAQISSLERRLESVNQADPELASTLSSVQEKVEQLAAQSFVTKEDLRAQSQGETIDYRIFFDTNSSKITSDAAEVLNSFIEREKNRTLGVSIFGFTDRSGSAGYNQRLAIQRATNVRSYLIQNGMDYTKIKALTGLGEDAAAAVLPDNAEDSQQRVVVLYSEQP